MLWNVCKTDHLHCSSYRNSLAFDFAVAKIYIYIFLLLFNNNRKNNGKIDRVRRITAFFSEKKMF